MKTVLFAAVCAVALAGCQAKSYSYSSSTTDVDTGSVRTITHVADGVTRTVVADGSVYFEHGQLTELPAGVTITVEEWGDGESRRGEVRNEGGEQVVYIADGASTRAATDEERDWLLGVFASVAIHDGPDEDELLVMMAEDPSASVGEVLAGAHELSFDSDRVEVMTALAQRDTLTVDEQLALVDEVWTLSFGSSQKEVLEELIARGDFHETTRDAITEASTQMSFDSDRSEVLEMLLRSR